MNQEHLPFILIFIGLLSISIIYYFKYMVNKVMILLSQAIALNKKLNYDVEDFLENIGDILYKLDFKDYGYKIYFLNKIVKHKKIISCKIVLTQTIKSGDYKVVLELCPNNYKGEKKDKFKIILNVLSIIIQENLMIKTESINKSFLNISKYHTFILHDVKNISQFFHTLQYNIDQCETQEDKNRLFEYLKSSNKLLDNKSSKIVKLLEQNSLELEYDTTTKISLNSFIKKIAIVYSLDVIVEGDASITQNDILLQLVFDNILKNIVDKIKIQKDIKVTINILNEEDFIVVSIIDSGTHIENINKIFEPFYSTKESGLGVGLYTVSTLLNKIDAKIEVSNSKLGVEFKIIFNKDK